MVGGNLRPALVEIARHRSLLPFERGASLVQLRLRSPDEGDGLAEPESGIGTGRAQYEIAA